ncbi:MAG: hypothetical protein EBR01_12605 [Proteobacteria bacterium]|nr:hypothetical protein [Pseudomonadota bacterium]
MEQNIAKLIVFISAVWVVIDAKKIGVSKGQLKGFWGMGPWGWFFITLLLWPIGFPFYLIKRPELKRINSK